MTLKKLNAERQARRACVHVIEMASGRDRLIRQDDDVAGELGDAIGTVMRSGKSAMVSIDGADYFLNAHIPPVRIIAIGAVHITQALIPIAAAAGYSVTVVDPRTAFASNNRFENCTLHAQWPEDVLIDGMLDPYTALAAVTHDPKIDDWPLKAALKARCFYVGALGSKKSHAKRLHRLASDGVSDEMLARIHAPIGLDIGASSPGEIAVAIMAEIVLALRGPKGR